MDSQVLSQYYSPPSQVEIARPAQQVDVVAGCKIGLLAVLSVISRHQKARQGVKAIANVDTATVWRSLFSGRKSQHRVYNSKNHG